MRLLVVGAGSTGGYFGGRLAQAGRDVTFLVRPPARRHLQANGLQIISPHGDFTLAPKLVTAGDAAAFACSSMHPADREILRTRSSARRSGPRGWAGHDDSAGAQRHEASWTS